MIVIASDTLRVEILPDYGALVWNIELFNKSVLYNDASFLGSRNARAGGIPILFPFAGKTYGDKYRIDGKEYTMPIHGFAKDARFTVELLSKDRCVLSFGSTEAAREKYFPFDFRFEIEYKIEGETFISTASVHNLSDVQLPCSLGFHPYFLTNQKERLEFSFDMRECWDYRRNGKREVFEGTPVLSEDLNHVFKGSAPQRIIINNPDDGYGAVILTDESFEVCTLCTQFLGACCIEPWQGLPNCMNTHEGITYIEPGSRKEFSYSLSFKKV